MILIIISKLPWVISSECTSKYVFDYSIELQNPEKRDSVFNRLL